MPLYPLHVVGYATGAALYAMLLAMAADDDSSDRLVVVTGGLGLIWNIGELLRATVVGAAWESNGQWMAAVTFSALGLLAAVVIHSAASDTRRASRGPRHWGDLLPALAYTSALGAAALHTMAVLRHDAVPDRAALRFLTMVLIALAPLLLLVSRPQPNGRRAMWMTGLALFALSALHVADVHGPGESWPAQLLGHHASIPLAFAILYQDYRFALADLFLKWALVVLLLVSLALAGYSWLAPRLGVSRSVTTAVLLIAAGLGSAWVGSVVHRGVATFVDRIILHRASPHRTVQRVANTVANATTERELLDEACHILGEALGAASVTWEVWRAPTSASPGEIFPIETTERPSYGLRVGHLTGGRRLLSGDLAVLERVGAMLGRRIDRLRLTQERYARRIREQEVQNLAVEAELRALRAQINPHFLFNALTTISYLVEQNPTRAVTTVSRLTTLLRAVLYTNGEFTTLSREIEVIRCYLDIERERFEERLDVAIVIPEALADAAIPALIVQPLVENAIKHGIAATRAGGRVAVSAHGDEAGRLRIVVSNTGAPLAARPADGATTGLGLTSIARRLAAHYGSDAALTLSATADGETRAVIHLPKAHGIRDAARAVGT